jgi:hypothetical protein
MLFCIVGAVAKSVGICVEGEKKVLGFGVARSNTLSRWSVRQYCIIIALLGFRVNPRYDNNL